MGTKKELRSLQFLGRGPKMTGPSVRKEEKPKGKKRKKIIDEDDPVSH